MKEVSAKRRRSCLFSYIVIENIAYNVFSKAFGSESISNEEIRSDRVLSIGEIKANS